MLFKGSNNLVQIYRSFAITGNYGRRSFSKYGISYYDLCTADVNIHASNRQIWHPKNTKVRLWPENDHKWRNSKCSW